MRVVLIILMGCNIINCCPVNVALRTDLSIKLKHQTQALMGATRLVFAPVCMFTF